MITNPNLASFFDTLLSDPRFYRPKGPLSAQVYLPDRTRDQFFLISRRLSVKERPDPRSVECVAKVNCTTYTRQLIPDPRGQRAILAGIRDQ